MLTPAGSVQPQHGVSVPLFLMFYALPLRDLRDYRLILFDRIVLAFCNHGINAFFAQNAIQERKRDRFRMPGLESLLRQGFEHRRMAALLCREGAEGLGVMRVFYGFSQSIIHQYRIKFALLGREQRFFSGRLSV